MGTTVRSRTLCDERRWLHRRVSAAQASVVSSCEPTRIVEAHNADVPTTLIESDRSINAVAEILILKQ